jgi:hypothetical protein
LGCPIANLHSAQPEKVIKVAIAHKLVRQIFGVIKNGSTAENQGNGAQRSDDF